MSQYIELKVQAWLQQLAALVTEKAGPPEPGKPPCTLALGSLLCTHPLPRIITRHYKSCSTFVGVRPELAWMGSHHSRTFYLKKEYHAQLLELVGLFQDSRTAASGGSKGSVQQAGAQAGPEQQQQQEQQPLDRDWPEYLAHERQLYEAHRAAAPAADSSSSSDEEEAAAPQSPPEPAAAQASRGSPSQRPSSHAATTSSSRGVPSKVEAALQSWLQQLAQLLGPIPASGQLPTIAVPDLKTRLPLPAAVLQHYGSLTRVVSARPELDWENAFTLHAIYLVGQYHRQLLGRSGGAAAGADRQQKGRQQPKSPAGAAYSRYLSSRSTRALAKSSRQLDSDSRRQVREWLERLAELLGPVRDPPTIIKLEKLRHSLPLPQSLKHFYGSMRRFVDAQPELAMWEEQRGRGRNYIYLVPEYHRKLLESSSAASRARKTSNTVDGSSRYGGEHKGRSLASTWRAKPWPAKAHGMC